MNMKMKIACVKTCGTLHFPEITLNNNNIHQQIREQLDEDVVFVNKHIVKGVVYEIYSQTDSKCSTANMNNFYPEFVYGNMFIVIFRNGSYVETDVYDFINFQNSMLIEIGSEDSSTDEES